MKSSIVTFALALTLLLSVSGAGAEAVAGKYVIHNDEKAKIYAHPHTITFPGQTVEVCMTSKVYDGDMKMVWGFDKDGPTPKNVKKDKKKMSDILIHTERNYSKFDKWYYMGGLEMKKDKEQCVDFTLDITEKGSGKYWICIMPATDSLAYAMDNDRFYCLDPWWNVSYLYRMKLNSSASTQIILSANGSGGIDGDIYWYLNQTDSVYVYCENTGCIGGDKAIATESSEIAWQNETSETGNNQYDIWNEEGARSVWHLGDGNDAVGVNNLGSGGNLPDYVDGLYGTCADFEATTGESLVDGSPSGLSFPSGLLVTAWIRPESSTGTMKIIEGDYQGGDNIKAFDMTLLSNNQLWCNISTASGSCAKSGGNAPDGEWTHVACMHTGSSLLVYVDGSYEGSCNIAGTPLTWGDAVRVGEYDNGYYFDGMIDEIRVFNTSKTSDWLSDDAKSGRGMGAEEDQPRIVITTPANTSYGDVSTLDLNWSLIPELGESCDSGIFSLNGGTNTTIGCNNYTISPVNGVNYLEMWSSDTGGTNYYTVVYFMNTYGSYDGVCIYDEMVPDSLLVGDNMMLQVFCPNSTLNYTMNDSCYEGLAITCDYTEIRAQADFEGVTMWRTLMPTTASGNLTFYLTNTSINTVNVMNLFIQDLSSTTTPESVRVTKVLESGEADMIEQLLDAEDKVIVHWIEDEKYTLYIIRSDGTITDMGSIVADDSTDKTITVSYVDVVPANTLQGFGFLFGESIDDINLTYSDTRGRTTLVTYRVYNVSNSSAPILYTDTCVPNPSCFFNYTSTENTTKYRTCFQALSTRNLEYESCHVYSPDQWDIPAFDNNPEYYALTAIFIALLIIAGSTQINIKIGLPASCVWMLYANYIGWFSALTIHPAAIYGALMFGLVVSIIYAFTEGEKNR